MVLAEDLRQAVLQAALQGKLTEQLETDSNVDEILKSIQEEKKRLVADKKSKKETALPKIRDEDIPFDIPDNWRWIKIGEIVDIKNGFTPKRTDETLWNPREIPWFTVEDIHEQGLNIFHTAQSISKKALGKTNGRIIPAHTVLLCCTSATIGRYAMTEIELTTNQQWNGLVIKKERKHIVCSDYILVWVSSLKEKMTEIAKSTTFPFLSVDKLANFVIPLPPIEEQQRIVDKINEIMPKIDEYEKIEKELETLKKEFPNNMKDALLQAAMQGKLTEQLESDCSVISIIEQCEKDKEEAIKEGKYKKEKFRGALCEEEYPFDIPDNWKWLYISDMSLFQEGPGILAVDFRTQGVPLIRIAGMQEDVVKLDGCNYLDPQMVEDKWKHFKLDLGDIVISTSASMDKIAEVTEETVGAIPYTGLIRFKMFGNINKEYFKYFIKSSFYATQINEQKSGGTIKHYGPTHLKKMLIPIPPIEEQQRIVESLEALLPLCETLKE